jgi:antitoxin component YwqK of YwqJK toxin-antitoxin module
LKTGKWKLYNDAGTLIKEETYINDIKKESE